MKAARQGFVHPGGPTEDALFDHLAGRLHPQAGEWIAAHVASCARCTAAVAHLEAVREALEPPPELPFQRQRDLQAVRRRLDRPRRRWNRILLPGFVALAACLAVLWMGTRAGPRLPAQPAIAKLAPAPVPTPWTVLGTEGSTEVEAHGAKSAMKTEQVVAAGGVVTVAPSARVVAKWGGAKVMIEGGSAGAQVRLVASRSDDRALVLERGRVVLNVDPLAPGARLAVVTPTERVTVHGTIFLVDVDASGTSVAVARGKVRVEALASRATVDVPAGMRVAPLPAAIGPLDDEDRRVFALLEHWNDAPPAEPAAAPASPSPEKAILATPTPPPSAHAAPSARAETATLEAARAEVLAGSYPRAIAHLESLRRHHLPATLGARVALLLAQALRLDHHARDAAPLLEKVARGGGPEAEQAQFLLAQTLERDLADPRRAATVWAETERRFPHGIFREEAAFRLGESLLQAGETQDGIDALERYLQAFGSGAHSDDAHLLVAAARRDRLSDCAGAIPHLRAVADGHGPRAGSALIGAARCLEKIGRDDEAAAAYRHYLTLAPHGRFTAEARRHAGPRASQR
ncbi:MAG TPA: tetratricopeptide repeat protein [Polyangia bacterium]